MGSFFTGEVDQPTAQSYGSVYKEAIEGLIKSMGQMYSSDSAYAKLFNALSRNDQSTNLTEYNKDLWNQKLDSYDYNKQYANALLAYQNAYGNQYLQSAISSIKAQDPEYWANYEKQGEQVLADLHKGNTLSDVQNRNVQQITRASQISRGNMYGNASAAQEVYNQFMAGEAMAQQRQANAVNFMRNSPTKDWNIGAITAYTPQVSSSGYNTLTPYAMSNANSVSGNAAQYAANNYRLQNGWEIINYNQPAPFVSMISGVTNGATSGALSGAAMGGPVGAIVGGVLGGASGGVMGAFSK